MKGSTTLLSNSAYFPATRNEWNATPRSSKRFPLITKLPKSDPIAEVITSLHLSILIRSICRITNLWKTWGSLCKLRFATCVLQKEAGPFKDQPRPRPRSTSMIHRPGWSHSHSHWHRSRMQVRGIWEWLMLHLGHVKGQRFHQSFGPCLWGLKREYIYYIIYIINWFLLYDS